MLFSKLYITKAEAKHNSGLYFFLYLPIKDDFDYHFRLLRLWIYMPEFFNIPPKMALIFR